MKRKMIAFLVALCLLLTGIPGAPMKANAAEAEKESASVDTSALAALPAYQPEGDCKILNYVHADVFAQGDHVARLHAEETMSSYAFLNRDGTKTVYYLDEVVKFEAADGQILEKDLTLRSEKGGYATTQNDVSLHLPVSPASGVRLSYNNKQVTLIPQGGTGTAASDGKAVCYANYYGPGMDLVYTPTTDGVKEEIILSAYSGVNSFTFLLNTGGLNLYQSANRYFLAESKLSDSKIWLGALEIFDAAIQPGPGEMTVETVMPGQQYRITLTVDEDYLTDPNTVYPVTIDPTLTVSDNTHGAGAIEDAPIYEGYPTSNFGSYQYNRAGYAGTAYKRGRTVVRLKGMLNDAAYTAATVDQVNSVKLYITDASGTTGVPVKIYSLVDNSTWTESNVTWNSVLNCTSTLTSIASPNAGGKVVFDLTNMAKSWKRGSNSNGLCGFLMMGANESTVDKSLCSAEHTVADKRPYAVLTYRKALTTYFMHYYDDTILGNAALISSIAEATETVNAVFSTIPVHIRTFANAFVPKFKTGLGIYECELDANTPCTSADCGSVCSSHHKNTLSILSEIDQWDRPADHIPVLWSNRSENVFCKGTGATHVPDSRAATKSGDCILVQTIAGTTYEQQKWMLTILLLHEVGHIFGLSEVYYYPSHDVVGGWGCVMEMVEYNWTSIEDFYNRIILTPSSAFCASCTATLTDTMYRIYLGGNQ